jgi:hypothetical protein
MVNRSGLYRVSHPDDRTEIHGNLAVFFETCFLSPPRKARVSAGLRR